jgi:hypothetical protein
MLDFKIVSQFGREVKDFLGKGGAGAYGVDWFSSCKSPKSLDFIGNLWYT